MVILLHICYFQILITIANRPLLFSEEKAKLEGKMYLQDMEHFILFSHIYYQ